MKYQSYGVLLLIGMLFVTSCIKDDFVMDAIDPVLRIKSNVDFVDLNESIQFEHRYLNNVGVDEEVEVKWTSSAPEVMSINEAGLAQSLQAGTTTITVSYEDTEDAVEIEIREEMIVDNEEEDGAGNEEEDNEEEEDDDDVVESIERTGVLAASSFYELEGDFTLSENEGELLLEFSSNYVSSSALPGLFVYLSNNPNTIANALEIGVVEVFEGAHSYSIPDVPIDEYNYVLYFCKPFNVKVGDGEIL